MTIICRSWSRVETTDSIIFWKSFFGRHQNTVQKILTAKKKDFQNIIGPGFSTLDHDLYIFGIYCKYFLCSLVPGQSIGNNYSITGVTINILKLEKHVFSPKPIGNDIQLLKVEAYLNFCDIFSIFTSFWDIFQWNLAVFAAKDEYVWTLNICITFPMAFSEKPFGGKLPQVMNFRKVSSVQLSGYGWFSIILLYKILTFKKMFTK